MAWGAPKGAQVAVQTGVLVASVIVAGRLRWSTLTQYVCGLAVFTASTTASGRAAAREKPHCSG